MELLTDSLMIAAAVAFISGLLITTITGSVKAAKYFLVFLSVFFTFIAIIALVLSGGLFVYLLFQLISLVIILLFIVIAGATCGGGLYMLIHHKPAGLVLSEENMNDFLPIIEFCSLEGISEERALSRIQSRFYDGGKLEGTWYVRKTELSTK